MISYIEYYDIAYDIIKQYDIIYYISISYMTSCFKNYEIIYDIIVSYMISCMISYIKIYDIVYDIIYDGNFSLSCANDIVPKTMISYMISWV